MAMSQEQCPTCTKDLVVIAMTVEDTDLEMISCTTCDTRSWRREGKPFHLTGALAEIGQKSGRRR